MQHDVSTTTGDALPATPFRSSIQLKQAAFVAAVVLLTAIAVGWVGYEFARRTLRHQIQQRLDVVAAERQRMLTAYVGQQHERVSLVASRTQLRRLLGDYLQGNINEQAFRPPASKILRDAKQSTAGFLDIWIAGPPGERHGEILVSTNLRQVDEGAKYADDPTYQQGKDRQHLGVPFAQDGNFVVHLAAPANDSSGKLLGVVMVLLDVAPLIELMNDPTGLGESGEVLIGRQHEGAIDLLLPARKLGSQKGLTAATLPAMKRALDGQAGFDDAMVSQGRQILAVYRPAIYQPVDFQPWGMVVKLDAVEAYAPVAALRRTLFLLDALLLVAGVGIAFLIARRMTRPIRQLVQQARVIASGDLNASVQVSSDDELGTLGSAFNAMADDLKQSYAELEDRVEQRTQELLAAQEELSRQTERTRRILDTATDAFVCMDEDGRIVDWNPAAERVFGWSSFEVMGKTVAELLIPEQSREAHRQGILRFLTSGEGPLLNQLVQVTALRKGELEFPIELTISPLKIDDKFVFNAFIHDITDRVAAEEQLHQAKEAAEEANRAKSDFLANMSHEIRTPMNAIMGMTELLLDTELGQTQREYLTTVLESAESLMTIINEILDFAKIEAGHIELEAAPFSLREMLGDTMKLFAQRADRKGLELACHIEQDVPDGVSGDAARLRQIVINLVGNALKFTESGEVVLKVDCPQRDQNSAQLHFEVRDTGIGIPREKQQHIFDTFTQADSSTTRRYGGTGLGLAICRQLVELMDGNIWVDSQVRRGSTFHFALAVELAPHVADLCATAQPIDIENLPVLVVDDNETNLRIVAEMLSNWGMVPTATQTPQQALQLAQQAAENGQPFRLVLTDVNMPEMDGFELAYELKRKQHIQAPIVVMITSGERSDDALRRDELGVAACLIKPVKQSELLDAILLVLGVGEPDHATSQLLTMGDGDGFVQPLRILVAEDGLANQTLALALLTKWGHTPVLATNGREAVEFYTEQSFDLILMDVEMPEMDGLEATRQIRRLENSTKKHVPILAMTAHAMAGDRETCLESGMDGYLGKPIKARHLHDAIREMFSENERAGATVTQPPTADAAEASEDAGVNLATLLEAAGNDVQLAKVITEAYLKESGKMVADVGRAIEQKNAPKLQNSAHALKGSVRYFGETPVYQQAWRLETMGRAGNLPDNPQTMDDLQRDVNTLNSKLIEMLSQIDSEE